MYQIVHQMAQMCTTKIVNNVEGLLKLCYSKKKVFSFHFVIFYVLLHSRLPMSNLEKFHKENSTREISHFIN